jgi:hypothetical protein
MLERAKGTDNNVLHASVASCEVELECTGRQARAIISSSGVVGKRYVTEIAEGERLALSDGAAPLQQ